MVGCRIKSHSGIATIKKQCMQDLDRYIFYYKKKMLTSLARGMLLLLLLSRTQREALWKVMGDGEMSRPGRPSFCYTTLPLTASEGDSLRNSDTECSVVGRCHTLLEWTRTTSTHTNLCTLLHTSIRRLFSRAISFHLIL